MVSFTVHCPSFEGRDVLLSLFLIYYLVFFVLPMSVNVLIVITNGHQQQDRSIGTAAPLFHYFIISILIVILGIIIINSLTLFILNLSFF